jgi:hypothetical protein
MYRLIIQIIFAGGHAEEQFGLPSALEATALTQSGCAMMPAAKACASAYGQ